MIKDVKTILKCFIPQSEKSKIREEETRNKNMSSISYFPVPFTLALRKRKFEEEQFTMYGIKKDKIFNIKKL